MKNELTCAVVRDLLPSFVEGLTAPETNEAVLAHLTACPDCAALRAELSAPEAGEAEAPEVDYLKKVKRRPRRLVALAVPATAAAVLAVFAAKVFVIGTPAQPEGLTVTAAVMDETGLLQLDISTPWSGTAYHGWTQERERDAVHIRARQVLVSPLFQKGSAHLEIDLAGAQTVYLCGRPVWQDGTLLSESLWRLYETRTPYAGDAPALGKLADALRISELLGPYTNQLQTAQPPYGWTLNFKNGASAPADTLLPYLGPQMLALVDNLNEVTWTFPTADGHTVSKTLTLDAVNSRLAEWTAAYNAASGTQWAARDSVKDYAQSPAAFQQLSAVLKYRYETRRMGVDDIGLLR